MLARSILASIVAGVTVGAAHAGDTNTLPQDGAYEVLVRLEMPHLEEWAASRTTTICLPRPQAAGSLPFPVLSENNPLARCPATNVERNGASLVFYILCEGRGAARARALYTLSPNGFSGRILMIMGGKNMVMTEVQAGRRVGACEPATEPQP